MDCQQAPDLQHRDRPCPTVANSSQPIHLCIVGGGFGGLYTALALRQLPGMDARRCHITLIEKRDRFLFTPLLYEVITGEMDPWEVAPSYGQLLEGKAIDFCQAEVQTIDLPHRRIWLSDDRYLSYDYLVLAAGTETQMQVVPGAEDHAYPFRTLADAERLQAQVHWLETRDRSPIQIAIAGAGANGVEIACKLADRLGRRGQIHLIDRGSELLKTFSRGSQIAASRALSRRGIQVHLDTSLEAIAPTRLTLHHQGQTRHLPTDLVLWTAGVQLTPWIRTLDCAHNPRGQVVVSPTLQLVDYPEVFALGDLAEIWDAAQHPVPATAQAAFQQAPHAARNLRALMQGKPLRPFRYWHLGEMMTLGTNNAVVSSFGITLDGTLARLIRRAVYIQRMPTFPHQRRVACRWLLNGLIRRLPHCLQHRVRPLCRHWLMSPATEAIRAPLTTRR